jgi:hypothetical protein
VPTLMIVTPGKASGSEVIVDPHSGQNRRCTSFPLSPRALNVFTHLAVRAPVVELLQQH